MNGNKKKHILKVAKVTEKIARAESDRGQIFNYSILNHVNLFLEIF